MNLLYSSILPRRHLPAVLFALLLAVAGNLAAAESGAKLLDDWLSGLSSLSSDFRQITLTADGVRMIESTGRLYMKRPGKFRWEYDAPNKQLIIADGKRVYLHDEDLDQVSHRSQKEALAGTPAQMIGSGEPVAKHFRLSELERDDDRTWVKLTPKIADSQVAELQVGFEGRRLETLIMQDSFGQLTRFVFTGTKRNPRLSGDLFKFHKPSGGDFLDFD